MHSKSPDFIFLDLAVEGKDAMDVARLIESLFEMKNIQTTMMTSKGESWDALSFGQPGFGSPSRGRAKQEFSIARLSAVVSRKGATPNPGSASVRIRDVVIHPGRREVLVNGRKIPLTYSEFGILHCLAQRPGWVFTRGQLLAAVRGDDNNTLDCAVNTHIVSLRRKLGEAGNLIETVRGVGYRLK
jgi:two-component system phosphate regulon response regulator PhoB